MHIHGCTPGDCFPNFQLPEGKLFMLEVVYLLAFFLSMLHCPLPSFAQLFVSVLIN